MSLTNKLKRFKSITTVVLFYVGEIHAHIQVVDVTPLKYHITELYDVESIAVLSDKDLA